MDLIKSLINRRVNDSFLETVARCVATRYSEENVFLSNVDQLIPDVKESNLLIPEAMFRIANVVMGNDGTSSYIIQIKGDNCYVIDISNMCGDYTLLPLSLELIMEETRTQLLDCIHYYEELGDQAAVRVLRRALSFYVKKIKYKDTYRNRRAKERR